LPLGKKIGVSGLFGAVLFIVPASSAIIGSDGVDTAVTMLIGWLLIFGGLAHLTKALKEGEATQTIVQALIAAACMIGGLYCLTHTVPALGTLAFPCRKCIAWTKQTRIPDLATTPPW
jgi:hypothetical protein